MPLLITRRFASLAESGEALGTFSLPVAGEKKGLVRAGAWSRIAARIEGAPAVTTLHLQRIEISNFRAYGDTVSFSLSGPGVTILTGPDELGASPCLEAIEWALTGRVRRLESLAQEGIDQGRDNGLLARREGGVPVARYGVALEFVSGEGARIRIERSAVREQEDPERFTEAFSPTPQQLLGLLRAGSRLDEKVGRSEKAKVTARIDRGTHELWMIQSLLHTVTKSIKQITELESRMSSMAPAELEVAQAARAKLPDLEHLKGNQAEIKAQIEQLSSAIKEEHEAVARLEDEILAAQTLQQLTEESAQASDAPQLEPRLASLVRRWFELGRQGLSGPGPWDDERRFELNWSRWPALLLDEPLQLQALAHSAAFIEFLGGLVRDRKYQVILSLPDEELAESVRRALEVADVPCVTWRHGGPGSIGVLDSTV